MKEKGENWGGRERAQGVLRKEETSKLFWGIAARHVSLVYDEERRMKQAEDEERWRSNRNGKKE